MAIFLPFFGDYKIYDPKYNKYNFRIHDYFLAKALDQVRPGGIVAFITTKGTLDKSNLTIRKYLAERAELIGAIRLPKEKVFVAMPSYKTKQKDENGKDIYQDICYPVTKEFREKLYSEIERAYAEAKEKQQEQAKEQSQKQGKEQSQDKDGFMKTSGEPLAFR